VSHSGKGERHKCLRCGTLIEVRIVDRGGLVEEKKGMEKLIEHVLKLKELLSEDYVIIRSDHKPMEFYEGFMVGGGVGKYR